MDLQKMLLWVVVTILFGLLLRVDIISLLSDYIIMIYFHNNRISGISICYIFSRKYFL